jgi:hypothetical protein
MERQSGLVGWIPFHSKVNDCLFGLFGCVPDDEDLRVLLFSFTYKRVGFTAAPGNIKYSMPQHGDSGPLVASGGEALLVQLAQTVTGTGLPGHCWNTANIHTHTHFQCSQMRA